MGIPAAEQADYGGDRDQGAPSWASDERAAMPTASASVDLRGTTPATSEPPAVKVLAWATVGTLVVCATSAVVLGLVNGPGGRVDRLAAGVVLAVSFPVIAALVATQQPRNRILWVFYGIGLTQGLNAFAHEYATYALATGSASGGWIAAWLSDWLWFPGYSALLTFGLLLFPDGRLPSRQWRPVAWLAAVSLFAMLAAAAIALPGAPSRSSMEAVPWSGLADAVGGVAFLLTVVAAPLCLAGLVVRWRRSGPLQRQQIKWFTFGGVLAVGLLVPSAAVGAQPLALLLTVGGALVLPVGAGVGILRHRLFDIDVVINRSLVYATMTGLVVGGYVAVVTVGERLFERTGWGGSVVAAALIAVAFQPVRQRVQALVNRLLYGYRDDPYRIVAEVGRGLENTASPAQLLPAVADAIATALRLPYVRIDLHHPRGTRVAAVSGLPQHATQRWPLTHQSTQVGELIASPRRGDDQLSEADQIVLGDLARHVSVAAHAVILTGELRASRERLRVALEDERRRIRRNLHDELGPSLATVVLGLEQVRAAGTADGQDRLLSDLKVRVQDAIGSIRSLVYDLRPPALDDLGLVAAVREQAARFSARSDDTSPSVTVEASGEVSGLPAAVEVAAFRIIQEALNNVFKHAHATTCTVTIEVDDTALLGTIVDNGRGLPPTRSDGIGMASMRERADELEGQLTVDSDTRGATVRFHLPLGISS